jgi:putative transposase
MPWRETCAMNLREQLVLAAKAPSANLAELCREFGVSRKTAYKWIARFDELGLPGLQDLSRRPHSSPLRASGEVVLRILELRAKHPSWGPKKLRKLVADEINSRVALRSEPVPSVRTVARVLERAGLVAKQPNELWTVDFKGWWRTRDGQRCEPLTVRDGCSRYVLAAQLLGSTRGDEVRTVFEALFERHGLPVAIQVDNGSPFGSTRSLGGLTVLSAWWVSLGIRVIFGRPAHPQDNGGHERMHLDMVEVELSPAANPTEQQQELDRWRYEFNHVRPHEALQMEVPASVYRNSTRRYVGPRHPCYPDHLATRRVNCKGYAKLAGRQLYIGEGLREQTVGLRALDDGTVAVHFFDRELGTVGKAA